MNGVVAETKESKGYVNVDISDEHTEIELSFEMKARFLRANPLVRADIGKVALMKGPLVYCLEEQDNASNLSNVFVASGCNIDEEFNKDLLGGAISLTFDGYRLKPDGWNDNTLYSELKNDFEKVKLKAVPYCYWGNREKNKEMLVWMKERL